MNEWEDTSTLRVHYDRPGEVHHLDVAQRTPAQKHMDQAMEKATELIRAGLETIEEAIEWAESVGMRPRNRHATIHVRQLLEEVVEERRVRQ